MKISCPNAACPNHGQLVEDQETSFFMKNGHASNNGGQKYQRQTCGKDFIVQPYILHGSQRNYESRLLVIRLLLSGESIRDICARANVAATDCYRHIRQVDLLMTNFEAAKLEKSYKEITFTLERCEDLPVEISYDNESLYLNSISLVQKGSLGSQVGISDSIKTLEKQLAKKLSIFKGHRRMSRSSNSSTILNIFRISYNFSDLVHRADTPAMRMGLESQPLSLQQLISLRL